MKRSVSRCLVVVASCLVGLGLFSGVALAAQVVVRPSVVAPGSTPTVSVSGFAAGEAVQVRFGSSLVGTLVTDAVGGASGRLPAPVQAAPGSLVVRAEGSGGLVAEVTVKLRTDWQQAGFRPYNTHYNPFEFGLPVSRLGQIEFEWRSVNVGVARGEAIIASGQAYLVNSGGILRVLDVTTHKKPWNVVGVNGETVAAAYRNIYASHNDGLNVYPHNCIPIDTSGTCQALWTSPTPAPLLTSPVIAGDTLYAATESELYAFPAECGQASCPPRWHAPIAGMPTADIGYLLAESRPLVYKGILYAIDTPSTPGAHPRLTAFDAHCRNDGGLCAPLWSFQVADDLRPPISISDNRLILPATSGLRVLSLSGCSNAGCPLLWRASGPHLLPAVGEGTIISRGPPSDITAYKLDCRRDGGICTPLWYALGTGGTDPVAAIANGAAHYPTFSFPLRCRTDGGRCNRTEWAPLYRASPNGYERPVTISDGHIYAPGHDLKLYSFGLPTP